MILPLLLNNWKLIAIAMLSLSLWGALKYASHESRLADEATQIANDNARIADEERAERKRVDQINAQYEADADKRRQSFNQKRADISHATPQMDGPLAPVLRATLDQLPEHTSEVGKHAARYTPPPV